MHKSSYKMGVLGHFMNCVPLPPLLTPHFFVTYRVTVESMKIMHKKSSLAAAFFMLLSLSDE